MEFILARYCGQETHLWLDYLIGSLLSSNAVYDLQKLNPYFSRKDIEDMYLIAVNTLLRANRIGHINRYLELFYICFFICI